ncbi:hypothetical protein OG930_35435 [Streptomyces sp. NBC_01799]|nr:hypothetical protein OG930_35435 [Streptomyces sp. NBC_01799]
MTTRTVAVTAAVVGAAVLATTGITYASAAGSAPAAPSVQQAAPAPGPAAGDGNGNGNGNGNGGRGGDGGGGGGGRGGDDGGFGGGGGGGRGGDDGGFGGGGGGGGGFGGGGGGGGRGGGGGGGGYGGGGGGGRGGDDGGYDGYDKGRIHINERSYSAQPDGCITVVSGLGSRSFNVRNDSRRTVELFRGATCDNGSPVATVGPWSTSNGVFTRQVHGGVWVKNGVVGSFRVVRDHYGNKW